MLGQLEQPGPSIQFCFVQVSYQTYLPFEILATTLRPGDFCATGALTTINNKLHYMISSLLYFLHRSLQDTPERLECPERHKTAENTLRDTQNSQAAAGSRPLPPTLTNGTLSPTQTETEQCVQCARQAFAKTRKASHSSRGIVSARPD